MINAVIEEGTARRGGHEDMTGTVGNDFLLGGMGSLQRSEISAQTLSMKMDPATSTRVGI